MHFQVASFMALEDSLSSFACFRTAHVRRGVQFVKPTGFYVCLGVFLLRTHTGKRVSVCIPNHTFHSEAAASTGGGLHATWSSPMAQFTQLPCFPFLPDDEKQHQL